MAQYQDTIEMVQRITVLEQKVGTLTIQVDDLKEHNKEILSKLDELLDLRSKGMGVVWLLSGLFGTGVMGAIYAYFGR